MRNKKIFLFIFLLFFLLTFNLTCYATTLDEIEAGVYSKYFIIKNPVDDTYYLFATGGEIAFEKWDNGNFRLPCDNGYLRAYKYNGFQWDLLTSSDIYNNNAIPYVHWAYFNGDKKYWHLDFDFYDKTSISFEDTIKYSNYNLTDNTNNCFFQQNPLKEYLRTTTVAVGLQGVKLEEVMKQILAIVGLILAVLVSFLGLRKGLKLLFKLLHRCLIF